MSKVSSKHQYILKKIGLMQWKTIVKTMGFAGKAADA
jgi:hypothetical protein